MKRLTLMAMMAGLGLGVGMLGMGEHAALKAEAQYQAPPPQQGYPPYPHRPNGPPPGYGQPPPPGYYPPPPPQPQRSGSHIFGNVQQHQAGGQGYGAQADHGGENVMIILDASYSMSEKLPGGDTRMTEAKRVILDVLKNMPPNKRVGLRVYGHSSNTFSACRATQQLVPIGTGNRHMIGTKLLDIRPVGATPISHSIRTSLGEDFRNVPGKKTILLISDGMETCDVDPCETAVELMRRGIDVKINVVGLGLRSYGAAEKQMKCVAMTTFGRYYSADTAAELAKSMRDAMGVHTEVQGQILTPDRLPPKPATEPGNTPSKEEPSP